MSGRIDAQLALKDELIARATNANRQRRAGRGPRRVPIHLIGIHGWLKGLALIAIGHVNRVVRPRLKLH